MKASRLAYFGAITPGTSLVILLCSSFAGLHSLGWSLLVILLIAIAGFLAVHHNRLGYALADLAIPLSFVGIGVFAALKVML